MRGQRPGEVHHTNRSGWLRAAVLGANDGIVSTTSLVIGVAAAGASHATMLLTGAAALFAGAASMASGEFVSVHSQSDIEQADLARESDELRRSPVAEHVELARIYVRRGLDRALAAQVAAQLMAHDALGAHARDELGITDALRARPLQAALSSALSFALGAALPLGVIVWVPPDLVMAWAGGSALVLLGALGALAARAGGAPVLRGAARVVLWGAVAMAVTAAAGRVFAALGARPS
jgi:VIT1/CCC1 family predicted Fe2+/Mn2+ transporter